MRTPRIAATLVAGTALLLLVTACQSSAREAAGSDSSAPASSAPASIAPSDAAVESLTPDPASAPTDTKEPDSLVSADPGLALAAAGAPGAYETDVAEVVFQSGELDLREKTRMRGQALPINQTWAALYSLIGCIFDCTATTFSLPTAKGPLTELSGTPGLEGGLSVLMAYSGVYASGRPSDAYPGQVYFTAAGASFLGNRLRENGFTELSIGELVGEDIKAFQTPKNWTIPQNPTIGELRLFPSGSQLPADFTPADGRKVDVTSDLGNFLVGQGYPTSAGKVAVPAMSPIPPFSWAVATAGMWPRRA